MALGTLPGENNDDESGDAIFAEINITPLTDVFLVLLIIFMVTSTVITQSGVKVNLPKAGAASTDKPAKQITLSIDSAGRIFLDKTPFSEADVEKELRNRLQNSSDKSVILAGDQSVPLGDALRLMDLAKRAGAERFAIATKNEGAKK